MGLFGFGKTDVATNGVAESVDMQVRSIDAPHVQAYGFYGFEDPKLAEFLKMGNNSEAGVTVNDTIALKNPAVLRCVSLISNSIGMLPLHLLDKETNDKARDHKLFSILHRRPNNFQSAYDFRTLMQMRALVKGNGYALIIQTPGPRGEIKGLIPLNPDWMMPKFNDITFDIDYEYKPPRGDKKVYSSKEIFHLRGMSLDGISGIPLVRQAADAIGLAIAAEVALSRYYKQGSFTDGFLKTTKKLAEKTFTRLRDQWDGRYSGAFNAGKTPILEEDLDYKTIGSHPKDGEINATRARQNEEIARIFGVPRPLLMVDETSWGSGIDVLGQFFVRYGLNPWFEAWQQTISRSLLKDGEVDKYEAKFNPGALLRGSMTQQGDFLAKALGAGGHQPWMHADEAREIMDMPRREVPPNPMMGQNGGTPVGNESNENGNDEGKR